MARSARRSRSTKETSIDVFVDLDGPSSTNVSTGIPFFDHMLDQLGKHGGFRLDIQAKGDLHI
ncbi:MAG: imidazoleglycerol-phosphate dehydratase, partial [Actinomycetota bacterium]